jgi:hypothetical protein
LYYDLRVNLLFCSILVTNIVIDNYNKQHSKELLSFIDPSNFMSILNKCPQLFEIDYTFDSKSANILNEAKEEYLKNIKLSVPEIFMKKLDRIQNMINYFTILESYLSSHHTSYIDELNKGNLS